ncbi:MAG: SDR family oxidoreductase [Bacteroidetes bacterium]|nr:MAG: SDR family oxidoreductase [Bacteroidota bacterium]
MAQLKDKVAVVTGGARDIGRQVSLALAAEGAKVAINYYDNETDAKETVAMIAAAGGTAVMVQGDMTKFADCQRLVAETQKAFGPSVDILVNVAGGLMGRHPIVEMEESFWDAVMNVNLKSVFFVCKAVIPHLKDGGAIVNFSTQAAHDGGGPGAIAYAAAKSGVLAFTRGLAKELSPKKVRVNAVSPGMINTTFHNTFTKPEVRQRVASMTPLGREGEAREVADLVLFLASERASFINGETVQINGGVFFA